MAHAHEEDQRPRILRQTLPVDLARRLQWILVAGDDRKRRGQMTVRHRNPRIRWHSDRRGDPRHHFKRHACFTQTLAFLASASEDIRIAALETRHHLSLQRFFDQHLVNLFLLQCVVIRRLAYINVFRIRPRIGKQTRICQTVIDDHVCTLDAFQSFHSDEPDVPRTCAHQIYITFVHGISFIVHF